MSGPVFAHGQLRLYLLALLERAPQHGYELIKGLSDQFGGTYRPSPGTIYPRLARLEEEGLIAKEPAGRKAAYRLTDAGRAELDSRRDELRETEGEIAVTVRERADQLRRDTLADARDLRASLTPRDGRPGARRAASAADRALRGGLAAADPAQAGGGTAASRGWAADRSEVPSIGEQVASRARLKEAETLLTLFRAEARAELRVRASSGALSQDAVIALRDCLDEALTRLRATP